MGLLSGIGDLLKQVSGGGASSEQFSRLAGSVPPSTLAGGLAEVFRSSSTPPFAQLASQLFAKSDGPQQASVLNTLVASAGPAMASQLTGGASSPLAASLAGNQPAITPEQASAIQPEDVQTLAEHAEKADPSIIDKLSQLYAAHPQLIQGLGEAAMAVVVQHVARSHEAGK